MTDKVYVYSTLANAISFVRYRFNEFSGVNEPDEIITIKGGAGITDPYTRQVPEVVETVITKEELETLLTHTSYPESVEYKTMMHSMKQLEPETVLEKLTGEDASKPITVEKIKRRAKQSYPDAEIVVKDKA